ncbi:MAG: phosphotransferase [Planctomycetaceae bacterium]
MTLPDPDAHPGSPPARAALRRGLEQVLARETAARGPFRITSRRPSPRSSTYLAEIVRVRFADGTSERLLCKYSSGVDLDPASPHRGLVHEAEVYERVLRDAPLSLPHVWGSFHDPGTGDFALVMRFYDDGLTSAQASEEGAVVASVRWLAGLHSWAEQRIDDPAWRILDRYEAPFYERWLDRTRELAQPLAAEYPWLDAVAAAYRDHIPALVAAPRTLIHGEFTTRNAFWAEDRIMPVDWETAAIGPGEIDLAVFTFDWELEEIDELETAYVEARWGGTPPAGFAETLLAARLYVSFHWIFSGSFRGDEPRIRNHLEGILDEAIRWGILPGDASGTIEGPAGSDLHAQ